MDVCIIISKCVLLCYKVKDMVAHSCTMSFTLVGSLIDQNAKVLGHSPADITHIMIKAASTRIKFLLLSTLH